MPNPADRRGNQGPFGCATGGCRTRATTTNYMKNNDNRKNVYQISTSVNAGAPSRSAGRRMIRPAGDCVGRLPRRARELLAKCRNPSVRQR